MKSPNRWTSETAKQDYFQGELMRHMDAVYDAALRLAGNPADADDLLQATMLKAYRFLDHYQTGTNAKAWLLTILKNTFINERRRQLRQPAAMELDDDRTGPSEAFHQAEPCGPAVGHEALMQGVSEEVSRALSSLSEEYRRALLLSDIDGYSYQEIADIMECPIGTVRSRISRARKHLREHLLHFASEQGILPHAN